MKQEAKVARCQYDPAQQCLVNQNGLTCNFVTFLNSDFRDLVFDEINKTVSTVPGMVNIIMKQQGAEYQFTVPRNEELVITTLMHCKKKKKGNKLVLTEKAKKLLIGTSITLVAAVALGIPGKIEKVYNNYEHTQLVEKMENNHESDINRIVYYLEQKREEYRERRALTNDHILNKNEKGLRTFSEQIYTELEETYGIDMLSKIINNGVLSAEGKVIIDLYLKNDKIKTNQTEVTENSRVFK